MKTIYILMVALCVGFTPSQALPQTPVQEISPLRFVVTEWSFGDIHEEGGTVSHVFEFTNGGKTPIALDRVSASCGCTTPEYPKTPIAPGEKARIDVIFDPMGLPGDFSKTITVISGGGKYRDLLTITGHVIPRPKSVEEEYPHDMGGGLRISNNLLAFSTVAQGRSAAITIEGINTTAETMTLAFEAGEESGLLDIFAPESICDGCRGAITFTYDLSERSVYGAIYDVVRPIVNGVVSSKTIYSTMTGIDDFEGVDTALAPRFFLDASFHDFGEVRQRTVPYTFRLTASNEGAGELHIRSVAGAGGLQTTLRAGMTIAPGASLPFEVMFYSNRYSPGEIQGSIRVVVDDPMRPTRDIRIAAIIK